mmetsp:Transcript_22738/g.35588  ORF Transcript_22738/g.35588 Transcript_22738/m.35588 type:complete len:222 (+) Transcript_22738:28-693(+)
MQINPSCNSPDMRNIKAIMSFWNLIHASCSRSGYHCSWSFCQGRRWTLCGGSSALLIGSRFGNCTIDSLILFGNIHNFGAGLRLRGDRFNIRDRSCAQRRTPPITRSRIRLRRFCICFLACRQCSCCSLALHCTRVFFSQTPCLLTSFLDRQCLELVARQAFGFVHLRQLRKPFCIGHLCRRLPWSSRFINTAWRLRCCRGSLRHFALGCLSKLSKTSHRW